MSNIFNTRDGLTGRRQIDPPSSKKKLTYRKTNGQSTPYKAFPDGLSDIRTTVGLIRDSDVFEKDSLGFAWEGDDHNINGLADNPVKFNYKAPSVMLNVPIYQSENTNTERMIENITYPDGVRKQNVKMPVIDNEVQSMANLLLLLERANNYSRADPDLARQITTIAQGYFRDNMPNQYNQFSLRNQAPQAPPAPQAPQAPPAPDLSIDIKSPSSSTIKKKEIKPEQGFKSPTEEELIDARKNLKSVNKSPSLKKKDEKVSPLREELLEKKSKLKPVKTVEQEGGVIEKDKFDLNPETIITTEEYRELLNKIKPDHDEKGYDDVNIENFFKLLRHQKIQSMKTKKIGGLEDARFKQGPSKHKTLTVALNALNDLLITNLEDINDKNSVLYKNLTDNEIDRLYTIFYRPTKTSIIDKRFIITREIFDLLKKTNKDVDDTQLKMINDERKTKGLSELDNKDIQRIRENNIKSIKNKLKIFRNEEKLKNIDYQDIEEIFKL